MSTQEIVHLNNNIRLLNIASKPINQFSKRPLTIRLCKIQTDVNDKHFEKTIEQTTTYYGK